MNDDFDRELRRALARIDPPAGFAERVVGRLPRRSSGVPRFAWVAALAASLVLATVGYMNHRQEQSKHAEAQKARQELVFALQLTSQKLTAVSDRLKKSAPHVRLPETNEEL